MDLKAYLEERRGLVNRALDVYLPQVRGPAFRVTQAMHYSLFVGGKRLRPILCLAAARPWAATRAKPWPWPAPWR